VRATLHELEGAASPLSTRALEGRIDLSHGRLEMMLKVLDVDGAVRRVRGGWEATGQAWSYDTDRYARVAAERRREQDAMLGYITAETCRMEYLRRELDDPAAAACGRCDNCTGQRWPAGAGESVLAAARGQLRRPGVVVTPRRMWPPGMKALGIDIAGRIPAGIGAEPGRAVGRLTGIGWAPRLRALLDAPDAPVPDDVFDAVVKVLAGWDWPRRPAAIVTVGSASRPRLVGGLASRISATGQLPYLGQLSYSGGDPPRTSHNSAQRLHTVWQALTLPSALGQAIAQSAGPVLAVDDWIDTGWTMTVAARLLREAGAPAVLPFALAVRG
jgi:ATP-dependent DNA helicase RecQ